MIVALLHQQFVQYAFLAGILVALSSSFIGYFVVIRSQSFAAHALAHIGFAGATGAILVGISSYLGLYILTILAALGIGGLEKRIQGRDIEIGMVLSFFLGLGVLFLKLYTNNASESVNILFGSLYSITSSDILISTIAALVSSISIGIIFRPLVFSSIDPEIAQAHGVPTRFLSLFFIVLLAITVAQASLVVGILLVFTLLVCPAAAAQHIVHGPLQVILLSLLFSLIFVVGGLFLALQFQGPPSFYIASIASITYLLVVQFSHWVRPHSYQHKVEEHGIT